MLRLSLLLVLVLAMAATESARVKRQDTDSGNATSDGNNSVDDDETSDGINSVDDDETDDSDDSGDWQETVILLRKVTQDGQEVFLRGGVGNGQDCDASSSNPEDDPCAIPISHLDLEMDSETPSRDNYAEGDLFLAWGENEEDQTSDAKGTPAQWTTNVNGQDYFNSLNNYGPHYWLVRVEMDCSKLQDGFFDVKGFVNGDWEYDISSSDCDGNGAATPPYSSINHIARCGYINVFEWNSPSCTIKEFK